MASKQPQFSLSSQVLEIIEILVLEELRVNRGGEFRSYVQSVAALIQVIFALDHKTYARWLPVHIPDMSPLEKKQLTVYQKFISGSFVVNKSRSTFSSHPLDHAHEQENETIKGEDGSVGLMKNPSALRRWITGGPELQQWSTNLMNIP